MANQHITVSQAIEALERLGRADENVFYRAALIPVSRLLIYVAFDRASRVQIKYENSLGQWVEGSLLAMLEDREG